MMPSPRPLLLPLLLTFSMLACKPVDVDETGYLQPLEIDTTSEEEPEEEQETTTLVVGNPSAVLVSGGVLTVRASSGDQTSVEVRDPAGSFVARVQAARGDLLELSYELDGRDVIELDLEGTAILPEPDCL